MKVSVQGGGLKSIILTAALMAVPGLQVGPEIRQAKRKQANRSHDAERIKSAQEKRDRKAAKRAAQLKAGKP